MHTQLGHIFNDLGITKRISKKMTYPKWVKDKDTLYHEKEKSYGTIVKTDCMQGKKKSFKNILYIKVLKHLVVDKVLGNHLINCVPYIVLVYSSILFYEML